MVRAILLPFTVLACWLLALYDAAQRDSIRGFFPTLFGTGWELTLEAVARNLFWQEAGWCWHYEVDPKIMEPGGPWKTWRKRFVLHDPVKAGFSGWTWQLSDAASALDDTSRA